MDKQMTAAQRIKKHLLLKIIKEVKLNIRPNEITPDNVDGLYEEFGDEDKEDEFRTNGEHTEIPVTKHSSHYDSRVVAAKLFDDSWVGFVYWSGGGKHGQPSEMPWLEQAFDVDMTERLEIVRTFKKVGAK